MIFICLAGFISGCSSPPDPSVPEGAFRRMGPCADQRDAKCLFRCLDRDSRWSVHTIYKTLTQLNEIVNKFYPEDARKTAFGTWVEEAGAPSAEEMFVVFCAKRRCLDRLAEGFGPVDEIATIGPYRARVKTRRGKSFDFRQADGKWGLDTYHDELVAAKLHLIDRLHEAERNAKAYKEQELAGGGAR